VDERKSVLAAFAIWVFYERSTANIGADRVGSSNTVSESSETVISSTTCSVEVDDSLLAAAMIDGTVTAQDVALLIGSVGLFQPACDDEHESHSRVAP